MNIPASQLADNLFYFLMMGLILEVSISAVFSIRALDELMQNTLTKSVKTVLILLISFGIIWRMPELRIFNGGKVEIPDALHMVLSALVLARLSNLFHDLFRYLRRNAVKNDSMPV